MHAMAALSISATIAGYDWAVGKYAWNFGLCQWVIWNKNIPLLFCLLFSLLLSYTCVIFFLFLNAWYISIDTHSWHYHSFYVCHDVLPVFWRLWSLRRQKGFHVTWFHRWQYSPVINFILSLKSIESKRDLKSRKEIQRNYKLDF